MPNSVAPPSSPADLELVARVAAGDESAIGILYDRYGAVLYAVAFRVLGERADAEEVVLEALAQAWRDAARFEPGRGSVAGWLATIARSRALDVVRVRNRRSRLAAAAAAAAPDALPGPESALDHEERRREVRRALDALSPAQRQAIELAYFEGLSQSEIAERLHEPLGTIKTRVRLGMQKLRECLRPFYFERGT